MTKFTLLLGAAGAMAVGIAGCTPPHIHHHGDAALKTISTLTCPETQGDLTRKSQAPDGKSCVYASSAGNEVTLQLVSLNGHDANAALDPIQTQLKAELPANVGTKDSDGSDHGRVDIDLPGIHIHANDTDKNDSKGAAKIDIGGGGDGSGGVHVQANDGGAQVSVNESGSGTRLAFVLTSDTAGPHGYKVVGYDARGPHDGPLAVVIVKSKADDADDLRDDAKELLKLNVGG